MVGQLAVTTYLLNYSSALHLTSVKHYTHYSNASGVVDECRPNGRMGSLSLYIRAKDHRINAAATDLSLSSLYQARFSATFS